MLALSPPLFSSSSTIGLWPFEETISHSHSHNYNYLLYKESTTTAEVSSSHQVLFDQNINNNNNPAVLYSSHQSPGTSSDLSMVKKLNHNASERDRRKKINALYSSLRSLLPPSDQMRKLSIPATISRVLKYIPELKQQVEGLTKKKEQILLKISKQEPQRKIPHHNNSGFVVSTTRLNDSEASIHISSYKNHINIIPLSQILLSLENDGLQLLNVSSSQTYADRVFYNLHFQVDKFQRLDSEILSEKVLSIMENKTEGNYLVN